MALREQRPARSNGLFALKDEVTYDPRKLPALRAEVTGATPLAAALLYPALFSAAVFCASHRAALIEELREELNRD